jgi:hypothetical protein
MQDSNFLAAVRKYSAAQQEKATESVDWNERRVWWTTQVTLLLDRIQGWLRPLIDDKTIEFERAKISVTEEMLGQYEVDSGIVHLGSNKLQLLPVASVILGGFGRIDMIGPNGRIMLILIPRNPNLPQEQQRANAVWFLAHPAHRSELSELTQETFEQVFADLFGIE